jgi:hypothetical protein
LYHSAGLLFLPADNGPTRPLARPSVGMGALAAARQTTAVPQASVAADIHQPLDIAHHFPTQVTLYLIVGFQFSAQNIYVFSSEVITIHRPIYAGSIKDFESGRPTDTVNIGQCDIEPFVSRQIYTN